MVGLIVAGAIASGVGRSVADRTLGPRVGVGLSETLARAARELNGQAPSMIDSTTRLDSVTTTANQLAYFYTLSGEMRPDWRAIVTPRVCSGMPGLLRSGALVVYRYSSPDGMELGRHEIVGSDCTALQ